MLAALLALAFLAPVCAFLVWRSEAGRTFAKFRGAHLVHCPEACGPAVVKTTALLAALTAGWRSRHLSGGSCTQWPEYRGCEQAWLRQSRGAARETRLSKRAPI